MEPSRLMREVIALRKLRDELEKYVDNNLHDKKVKPLLKPFTNAIRFKYR